MNKTGRLLAAAFSRVSRRTFEPSTSTNCGTLRLPTISLTMHAIEDPSGFGRAFYWKPFLTLTSQECDSDVFGTSHPSRLGGWYRLSLMMFPDRRSVFRR